MHEYMQVQLPRPESNHLEGKLLQKEDLYKSYRSFQSSTMSDWKTVEADALIKLQALFENLPDGWTRNWEPSKAPFRHADGRESFRHPNRPAIQALTDELQAKAKLMVSTTSPSVKSRQNRTMIQKLRKMIQAGLPIAAVEQRAKLEGINIADILDETKEPDDVDGLEETCPIPASLVKKYRRMLQSGVPLKGVQSKAFLDGGWTPEQVTLILGEAIDVKNDIHKDHYLPRPVRRQRNETLPVPTFFDKAADGSLTFQSSSLLGALVRKMIQTVQKRAVINNTSIMQVDSLTLYHSLGALQGVQMARDCFNSTCRATGMSLQEIRGKRQGFAEIAKTIGMELPKEIYMKVDIDGLDDLVRHIQTQFSSQIAQFQSMVQDGWYDFESLSVLYPPGSKVVAKNAGGGGIDMTCQVIWNRYEQGRTVAGQARSYFKVCFQFLVAVSASHATMVEVVEGIDSFEGRRQILSSLNFIPTFVYPDKERDALLARFRSRGRTYNRVALCGTHVYMAYDKGSFFAKRAGGAISSGLTTSVALATGGRVIVDNVGAYHHGHSLGTGYDPMVTGIKYKYKEYMLHERSSKQGRGDTGTVSDAAAKERNDDGLVLFDQVPDDFLDMVWPFVIGFSLTTRGWGDVLVDGLEDIQWNEDVFDRLVLPENRKTMVKALVRHGSDSFHDLIQGKGEGTVFLLYGPPGCGKTLTAEAVAELLHKPLYSLSLGTLGTTAEDLERRLGEIMTLSARWDTLILLDEADSFLETRSSKSSLERNAMVSVMLRLVEYFSGILFLTSNRMDSLDPAFQTRITLALRYEALGKEARAQVWRNLLLKSGLQDRLDDGTIDVSVLAKWALNGREIKNSICLAMAMAREKNEPIAQAMLLEAVQVVDDYKIGVVDPYDSEEIDHESDHRPCFFLSWFHKKY